MGGVVVRMRLFGAAAMDVTLRIIGWVVEFWVVAIVQTEI